MGLFYVYFNPMGHTNSEFISYKQRVMCFLLSHVNAACSPVAKVALLHILKGVSDKVKAQVLLPTIQEFVQEPVSTRSEIFERHSQEFYMLIMSCFDASVCNDLNDKSSSLWPVFLLSLRHCFSSSKDFCEGLMFASLS
jgi:U3 small nucleolar RNA-associated protein 10